MSHSTLARSCLPLDVRPWSIFAKCAGTPVDDSYYRVLQVPPSATSHQIKAAYRRLALRLHPDVNDAPDAQQAFAQLASAYGACKGCNVVVVLPWGRLE